MDASIRHKIVNLTQTGVRRLPEMRRHLRYFVCEELFNGTAAPPLSDARYWPNSHAILSVMYRTAVTTR